MAEFTPPSLGADYNPAIAAKYFELSSGYDLSVKQAEASAKLSRELASASYQYGRGNLLRAEPQRIKANINAANSQGLAESGQLAKAQTNTQSEYAQKQLGLSQQREAAIKRAALGEGQAKERRETGDIAGYKTAVAEQANYLTEHPPVGTQSTPSTAPSSGWVQAPGGSYRTGPGETPPTVISSKQQPSSRGQRKAAAKKAVG